MEKSNKKSIRYFLAIFAVFLFWSCENNDLSENEKIVTIASKTIDCQGFIQQQCLLIKENKNEEWQYFYSPIIGFEYKEGFEYEVLISEKHIENPPQDSSSIEYTLIKIISKTKKTSENLSN